jgi:hypothetical protein
MFANLFRSRDKHKHTRLPQSDSEGLDSDTLLCPSPSRASLPLKASAPDPSIRDIKIAVRTLVLCTIVYVGAGLWFASSFRHAAFVSDADDFCLQHVSRYCKSLCVDLMIWLTEKALVVRDVKPGWHDKLFNGTFLHQNEYRQSAGPEVDAAWAALGVNCKSNLHAAPSL